MGANQNIQPNSVSAEGPTPGSRSSGKRQSAKRMLSEGGRPYATLCKGVLDDKVH